MGLKTLWRWCSIGLFFLAGGSYFLAMFGDIRNHQGHKLDYTFHAGLGERREVVVLGHGVTGNKDRELLVAVAEGLTKAGISCLRFSFSGNGGSEGLFEESNITQEVEDLGAVLDAVGDAVVSYAGHSMGAAVGVIRAAQDKRIRKLVSLAGMVRTAEFAKREFGEVTPGQGVMWEKPECPLSAAFMDDLNGIGDVLGRVPQIRAPWLLIHGSADDVVPIDDSRVAYEAAVCVKQLVEVDGANHLFEGESLSMVVEKVVDWIRAPQ